ncbi:MAG: type 4a pilus biogenesis protein PilO [Deltaproteobacteria bacterium]|nr:type 4a pilus biogenesis protein PilO [Deltaproteobacteria bacterium]
MAGENFFDKVEKIKMPVRIAIVSGTLVLLAGLFVWFVWLPKTEEIKKTKQEIENLERQITQARIKAKDYEKLNQTKAKVDNQFQEALLLLPNEKEIPSLLRKLTELGAEAQLDVRSIQPQSERPKEFYLEIPIAIEVRGEYHNVAVFFDKVGHMERIMNIHNVSMRPISERSTTLITRCSAVTYRFKGGTE